ncbi:hypothetical protein [Fibrella forsythiae]|uniref:Uncharacterized protein n=1 Tax=Fibrella forsythiae TaxID=2817061 RepID=A0ABS3JPA8_9BACT|nr:hypothetical protein [Fibrella forsythiae]MBO0951830.1 hypothetical protein [Fibrella forsythiae]
MHSSTNQLVRWGFYALLSSTLFGSLQSCTTTKAVYTNPQTASEHGVEVIRATARNRLQQTGFAKAAPYIFTGIGGGYGAVSGIEVEDKTTGKKENSKAVGALLGALGGGLLGYCITAWSDVDGADNDRNYIDKPVANTNQFSWLAALNRGRSNKLALLNGMSNDGYVTLVKATDYWLYVIADQHAYAPFLVLNETHQAFLNNNSPKTATTSQLQQLVAKRLPGYRFVSQQKDNSSLLIREDAQPSQITCTNRQLLDGFVLAFPNADPAPMFDRSIPKLTDSDLAYSLERYETNRPVYALIALPYIQRASSFTDALSRYRSLKNPPDNLVAPVLAEKVNSVQSASVFLRTFPDNTQLHNSLFDRLYTLIDRRELPDLIRLLPNATSQKAARQRYVVTATHLPELIEAIDRYPDPAYARTAQITTSVEKARVFDDWLQQQGRELLGTAKTTTLRTELQTAVFGQLVDQASTDRISLQNTKTRIGETTWLVAEARSQLDQKIDKYESAFRWHEAMTDARQTLGEAAPFAMAMAAPNHELTLALKPELERLTQKFITIEEDAIWTAMGNRSLLDGLAESADGVKNGGSRNIFVMGFLKNTLAFPITVEVRSTLNYFNTKRLSFMSSTSAKTWAETYYVQVPAESRVPFMVIYKDFRTGGTVGKGLFSAGDQSYLNEKQPYSLSFRYFDGPITPDVKARQQKLIETVVKNKGNVEINDSAEQKAERDRERITAKAQRDRERQEDDARTEQERQEEARKKADRAFDEDTRAYESDVNDCMVRYAKKLSEVTTQNERDPIDQILGLNNIRTYYRDPSFWGTNLYIVEDDKGIWKTNYKQGEFVSKDAALRAACETYFKKPTR